MSPSIFAQIFTIIGLRKRAGMHDEFVAIPLVYALLSGKKTRAYAQVLKASKKWRDLQARLESIHLPILQYLENLACNVNIS